ncbi:unnamed protein product [Heligmosomoides polygyrus]|uniref:THUMP domain-containing protein n=1 Tax=Heligmosomoides polygyrus TaxID=6339 RepID=A0A3P8CID7_HELPZ|nr:unnamed protein product [Heligmosomoides polygyrus]
MPTVRAVHSGDGVVQLSSVCRVTCNRAGEKSHHSFSSMDAARALGGRINHIFGWRPDMENFDMEVLLNIRNDTMLVMVALNRESLFKRNVSAFGPTTLRSTICYCMLLHPQMILDPMCGGGSVPLEAALSFPGCLFIGTDVHTKALERCSENKVRLDYSKVKLNSVDTSASWLFLCKTVWLVEIYVSYA